MRARRTILAFMTSLPLVLSCSDEGTAPCVEVPAGRIEGTVWTGDEPGSERVRVWRFPDASSGGFSREMPVDSAGHYAFDLPEGNYLVSVVVGGGWIFYYSPTRPCNGSSCVETLRVVSGAPPVRADFLFGRVDLRFLLPSEYEGMHVGVYGARLEPGGSISAEYPQARVRDGEATIELPAVVPGPYAFWVGIDREDPFFWRGEWFWLQSTRDPHAADRIEAIADTTVTVVTDLRAPPARLEGEVVGSWQLTGEWPPEVWLVNSDSAFVARCYVEPTTGFFAFNLVRPEPVRVAVDIRGVRRWVGGEDFDSAPVYPLEPGSLVTGIRHVESGLLLDIEEPLHGTTWWARVTLHEPTSLREVAAMRLYGGDRSPVPFPNLEPGSYKMRIEADPPLTAYWLDQWHDRVENPEEASVLEVPADGGILRVPLVLEKGGSIAGTLPQPVDAPIRYEVQVTQASEWIPVGSVEVWASPNVRPSRFLVAGLRDGAYKVGVRPAEDPEFMPLWYPSTVYWDSAGVIVIQDAADVTGIDIVQPGSVPRR